MHNLETLIVYNDIKVIVIRGFLAALELFRIPGIVLELYVSPVIFQIYKPSAW